MFATKLKVALVALSVLGASLGMLACSEAAAPLPAERLPVAPAKGKLLRLLQERLKIAEKEFEARNREYMAGRGLLSSLHDASRRLLKADLELARNKAARIAARRAEVRRATETAKLLKEQYDAGRLSAVDHLQGEFYRLDAEIELERELSR